MGGRGKCPAFNFFPADWLRDTQLQMGSASTRGIWINLLCAMWWAPTRGRITGTREELRKLGNCTDEELTLFLEENSRLRFGDVRARANRICLANRRMIRDELIRTSGARRQQRLRDKGGGDPERWIAIRVHILQRDNYTCGYCGKKAKTVDHIIPKSKGGDESDTNLIACCKSCNMLKNNRSIEECGFTFWGQSHKHNTLHNILVTSPLPNTPNTPSTPDTPKTPKEEKTPLPPEALADGFGLFWKQYPRKVAKQAAIRAWKKLGPSAELRGMIFMALGVHTRSAQWTRDGGEYIPYPASWLNGRRWEDEVAPERPNVPKATQQTLEAVKRWREMGPDGQDG